MENKFKVGDIVTWGTGEIHARIDCFDAELTDLMEVVPLAMVSLTKDHTSSCGQTFAKGTYVSFYVAELRAVH